MSALALWPERYRQAKETQAIFQTFFVNWQK
jgi:hypothetical protein